MTGEPSPGSADPASAPAQRARRRPTWQVGLRTTLLIVAFVAIAFAIIKERSKIVRLRDQISVIQPLVRELQIDDPSQFAVMKLEAMWLGEEKWDVYLPPSARYRLQIATRDVVYHARPGTRAEPMPAASHHFTLGPGRHLIELEQTNDDANGWHFTVISDGKPVILAVETTDWNRSSGMAGGSDIWTSQQIAADQVVELYRSRVYPPQQSQVYNTAAAPKTPGPGLLLWINREDAVKP